MLAKSDPKIDNLIKQEQKRQSEKLVLIASENYTSSDVREPLASVLTHKYSEGEPGKRYYQGNEFVDQIEIIAGERALKAFGLSAKKWHVNCKAVSASIANLAVMSGLLEPGDKILAMDLTHGGHLSHGWKLPSGKNISLSSKIFDVSYYGVEKKTNVFDYTKIEKLARKIKPKLIISGGTAYAREINYKKMGGIAKQVGAYYLADIAHEAGLIAGGALNPPFPHCDTATMSTQKSLRGPRGAIIICKQELSKKIDFGVFPGLMGGPCNNVIASIAVTLKETGTSAFKKYAAQTIKNAKALADALKKLGFEVVTGGTDKHLVLIDLRDQNIDGHDAAVLLDEAGMVCNKNTVPFETGTPMKPSGIRLGTPALTSRNIKEAEMKKIAEWIYQVLIEKKSPKEVFKEVKKMTNKAKFTPIK